MSILIDWCHGVLVLPPEFFFSELVAPVSGILNRGDGTGAWTVQIYHVRCLCRFSWCTVDVGSKKIGFHHPSWIDTHHYEHIPEAKGYQVIPSHTTCQGRLCSILSLKLPYFHSEASTGCFLWCVRPKCNHMVSGETNMFYFRHFLFHPTGMTTEEQIFGMVCNHQPLGGSKEKPEAFAYPILLWLNCCPDSVS